MTGTRCPVPSVTRESAIRCEPTAEVQTISSPRSGAESFLSVGADGFPRYGIAVSIIRRTRA
ncbi:hypothetical protein D7Z26_20105 [Cohnella endophytica]|uniref:Uncharacterized protein n=1 Tax=Cohnella endophytica TaxID=2419778 RepID=A0A494XPW4_9BACL|nr:hypothetical protein D7Z26_20105 [Cohnella endophytica]